MIMLSVLIIGAVAALQPQGPPPRPTGTMRTDLQRHDLSVSGWETLQALVSFAPGASFLKHRHPGEEIIYITSGSIEYVVEGKPPITVKAGEALFVPHGAVHSARNVGAGPAAELATYVLEKGKPLVEFAE
jgi:quercetin dioxygenase-like cupin family protein